MRYPDFILTYTIIVVNSNIDDSSTSLSMTHILTFALFRPSISIYTTFATVCGEARALKCAILFDISRVVLRMLLLLILEGIADLFYGLLVAWVGKYGYSPLCPFTYLHVLGKFNANTSISYSRPRFSQSHITSVRNVTSIYQRCPYNSRCTLHNIPITLPFIYSFLSIKTLLFFYMTNFLLFFPYSLLLLHCRTLTRSQAFRSHLQFRL